MRIPRVEAIIHLVGAALLGQSDEWQTQNRCMQTEPMGGNLHRQQPTSFHHRLPSSPQIEMTDHRRGHGAQFRAMVAKKPKSPDFL